MRSNEVLPQPEGPSKANISPGLMEMLTSSSAVKFPKRWVIDSISRELDFILQRTLKWQHHSHSDNRASFSTSNEQGFGNMQSPE
ncbi:hypothetical protein [Comamonas endophytica]|uniref:hypothetical protein n=1 Tax=Comamonas endophytica TaxID=2949090 RepID=UPI00367118A8